MIHELKIQKQWADAKLAGEKPFEIRRNDRGFQKGDIVHYTVVDPKTGERYVDPGDRFLVIGKGDPGSPTDKRHPLEKCDFVITYVREGADGLEKGYCVYADQPVPKKAPEGPEGSARVRGETFSEDFMRITKDGINALEKALWASKGFPYAPPATPGECGSYEPDDSFLTTGEKPCRHYNPVAFHNAIGTGTCKCPGCVHCGHECPTRGGRYSVTVCMSSPVSADLGSGATPSNGTAEPLAPPSPLADTPDKDVHTDGSVPKAGAKCNECVPNNSSDGMCRYTCRNGNLVFTECRCEKSPNFGKTCVMGNWL